VLVAEEEAIVPFVMDKDKCHVPIVAVAAILAMGIPPGLVQCAVARVLLIAKYAIIQNGVLVVREKGRLATSFSFFARENYNFLRLIRQFCLRHSCFVCRETAVVQEAA